MGWGFLMPVGLLGKTVALTEVNCLMSTVFFSPKSSLEFYKLT